MIASSTRIGTRCLAAAVIIGTLGSNVSPVFAAETHSAGITVKYTDLNLATSSGALVLYERIQNAAKSACTYFWFKTDADAARCLYTTITEAVNKVNKPAVSAVYNAKYKTLVPLVRLSQSTEP